MHEDGHAIAELALDTGEAHLVQDWALATSGGKCGLSLVSGPLFQEGL